MRYEVPRDHPLRRLFRWATHEAFRQLKDLADEQVETYISEEILGELVHIDRIYWLRNAQGKRLTDLAEMVMERRGTATNGFERELEVNQHIGDLALFTAGLFPEGLNRKPPPTMPLVAQVGEVLVPCSRQLDYYVAEGKSAYQRASELWRRLSRPRSALFGRLSDRFEEYVGAMSLIRAYLREDPYFRRCEDALG